MEGGSMSSKNVERFVTVFNVENITRDIKAGMLSLRDLVVASTIYGLLPSLGIFLDSKVSAAIAPIALGLAIVSGSGGAFIGYLWLRPSEEKRELDLALRSTLSIKLMLLAFLISSVISHLLLWWSIENRFPWILLLAISFASFFTLGFYGATSSGIELLRIQREGWSIVGREQMHKLLKEYRKSKREREWRLEESGKNLEELIKYSNMLFNSL